MRTLGPWKRVWRSMASVALLVTNVGLVQLAGVQPAHAVNVLILSQGFDGVTPPALPAGWTATRADGRNSDQTWQTSTPGFTTDPNAVSVGAHGHVTDMILESPAFVAGPTATVRFYKQAILQATTGQFFGDNLDGAVLEIKMGTASYIKLVAAGGSFTAGEGYNRKMALNQDNPLAGRMAWSGHQLGSSLTSGTLPGSASGQTVRLRWRLGTSKHTANQAGQNWFLAKAFTIDSVEIYSDKAGQTISFTTTAPSNPPVGGTYTPTATATSGLPVAFSIASGSSSVCSIGAADLVTFNAIGSCTIQATQGGNYAFTPAGGCTSSSTWWRLRPTSPRPPARTRFRGAAQAHRLHGPGPRRPGVDPGDNGGQHRVTHPHPRLHRRHHCACHVSRREGQSVHGVTDRDRPPGRGRQPILL